MNFDDKNGLSNGTIGTSQVLTESSSVHSEKNSHVAHETGALLHTAVDTRIQGNTVADKALAEGRSDRGKVTNEADHYLPIDKGWAWWIAFACFMGILFTGGMMRAYGVFFIQFQRRFNASAAEVSTANIIQNVFGSFSALFVMTIGLELMSCRTAVMIGGVLTVVGYLIAGYATSIYMLYFSVGVLAGTGNSMILPPMLLMLGVYFNKHRGLANSIFASGGSVGGLLFGPVVVKLFDKYTYTGGMLIVAGLFMHIFISAALLRPLEFFKRNNGIHTGNAEEENDQLVASHKEKDKIADTEYAICTDECKLLETPLNFGLKKAQSQYLPKEYDQCDMEFSARRRTLSLGSNSHLHHTNADPNQKQGQNSKLENLEHIIASSVSSLYAGDYNMYGSFINMNATSKMTLDSNVGTITSGDVESSSESGCCLSFKNSCINLLCTVFDLTLLKDPLFILFLVMCFCLMPGMIAVTVFLPPHLNDVSIINDQIAILLFTQSVLDLLAKISMGIVADRHLVKRSTILAWAAIILATVIHLLRFLAGFHWMLFLTIITGICCGQFVNIYAVILMDLIGPVRFQKSIGMSILCIGLANALVFPLVGFLRDVTGSYIWSFHLLGMLGYLGAACVFIIERLHTNKKKLQAANN